MWVSTVTAWPTKTRNISDNYQSFRMDASNLNWKLKTVTLWGHLNTKMVCTWISIIISWDIFLFNLRQQIRKYFVKFIKPTSERILSHCDSALLLFVNKSGSGHLLAWSNNLGCCPGLYLKCALCWKLIKINTKNLFD